MSIKPRGGAGRESHKERQMEILSFLGGGLPPHILGKPIQLHPIPFVTRKYKPFPFAFFSSHWEAFGLVWAAESISGWGWGRRVDCWSLTHGQQHWKQEAAGKEMPEPLELHGRKQSWAGESKRGGKTRERIAGKWRGGERGLLIGLALATWYLRNRKMQRWLKSSAAAGDQLFSGAQAVHFNSHLLLVQKENSRPCRISRMVQPFLHPFPFVGVMDASEQNPAKPCCLEEQSKGLLWCLCLWHSPNGVFLSVQHKPAYILAAF